VRFDVPEPMLMIEPEELAGMATLLASDDGRGITGQVISVDGGYKV
jgi:enoyl-[acyl-carrier-protein] reductase (NADH)